MAHHQTGAKVDIRPLRDIPEALPDLAALLCLAWPDWYGPAGSGDAMADLRARCDDGMPMGWAALLEGRVVGTVAVDRVSYGAQSDEGPWLVGLATVPDQEGRGIASALVAHLTEAVPGPMFSTTKSAAGLLRRQGWQQQRVIEDGWQVWRR